VATDGWGLYRLKIKNEHDWASLESKNIEIVEIEVLKNKIITSIFMDKHNHIWAATNFGAYEVWITKDGKTQVKKYSIAKGLPTNEVNVIYVNNQYVFIGTAKGLTRIPLQRSTLAYIPRLHTRCSVNGEEVYVSQLSNLHYTKNNLRFDYVGISFRSDKNITYHYRLHKNGKNEGWQKTQAIYKEFLLLTPGTYEFEIKAEDIDGTQTESQHIYFTIQTPWWESNIFRYSVWGLLFAAVIIGSLWRIQYIQRKSQKQTRINQKISELELKALQAQLDEHFVFNCLNSIQSFIV
jgi:hypothetical protein